MLQLRVKVPGCPMHGELTLTPLTSSYPMKLRVMYACCSSVSEARFLIQHGGIICIVMECYEDPCFLALIIFSMTEIVRVSVFVLLQ